MSTSVRVDMSDENIQHFKGKPIILLSSWESVFLPKRKKDKRDNDSVISTHYELFSLVCATGTFNKINIVLTFFFVLEHPLKSFNKFYVARFHTTEF